NGIRFSPDGNELCVAVTGPPGGIHCLSPSQPAQRRVLRSYPTEGPDNFAFGRTGRLYVALALANQVGVVDWPSGNEVARFSGPAKGSNGSVPWDAPAGVAFDNAAKRLVVVNHALVSGLVNPTLFVVFDVYVNDTAKPLNMPVLQWAGG
ncbi:MAG TPA: hypothetical protein VKA30_12300, partial [Actinomycetota bacterium]|nr:hypothetical protein [Actinomycetota bacterium]